MQAYKFNTRISNRGVISLPFVPDLFDKEVELIIVPKVAKAKKTTGKSKKARAFVNKWAGFLNTDKSSDDLKSQYLTEKYK